MYTVCVETVSHGLLTFTVNADLVNKSESGKAEKQMDGGYISSVLDAILETDD